MPDDNEKKLLAPSFLSDSIVRGGPAAGAPVMPEHEPYYYKTQWGAYKGHVKGMFAGLVIGAMVGAGMGLGVALLAPLMGISLLGVGLTVAAFSSVGSLFGGQILGGIGTSAGVAASIAAEDELRERYPDYRKEVDERMFKRGYGYGHHYEYPPDRDMGKHFHWRTGVIGMGAGAALGGIIGTALTSTAIMGEGMLTSHLLGAMLAPLTGGASLAIPVVTAAFALFGLSFGVERSMFKTLFNYTDGVLSGKIFGGDEREIQNAQRMGMPGKPADIAIAEGQEKSLEEARRNGRYVPNGHQRSDEFYKLQKQYYHIALWEGFAGNTKGLLAGLAVGALMGAGIGAAIAGLGAIGLLGLTTGGVMLGAAAVGSIIGMEIFTATSRETGAHAAVRETLNKRRELGLLKNPGVAGDGMSPARPVDTDTMPQPEHTKKWFDVKSGVTLTVVGALLGAVMAPVAGAPVAALAGAAHLAPVAATALSSLVMGLVGATFFMTMEPYKAVARVTDRLLDGHLFEEGLDHDSPRSALTPVRQSARAQEQSQTITPEEMAIINQAGQPRGTFREMVSPGAVGFRGGSMQNSLAMEDGSGQPLNYEQHQHVMREIGRRKLAEMDVSRAMRQ